MLVNIFELENKELIERVEDFNKKGGCIRIGVYKIKENYEGLIPGDEYFHHLIVARQIIEKVNYKSNFHWNRCIPKGNRQKFGPLITDFDKLDHSGEEINIENFLGPYWDLIINKPIVRGRNGNNTINSYFYFDQEENLDNKIDIQKRINTHEKKYPKQNGNFVYAFMEPPYSIQTGKTIFERGSYLITFMDYFFDDVNQNVVYSWSTDCAIYFDAGKEWWGTFFWTIYNPVKDWYIGMVASETD